MQKEFNSIGQLEIPYESLIEYTVNALVHRSLNIKSPIRIFIFDNRVEIHSPGALPNGLTVKDIKNGTSMPRNMFLFTKANYLLPYTGAGSGIRRAIEYDPNVVFSNGIDQREITNSSNEFLITIPRNPEKANNQVQSENDPANSKTDLADSKTDPADSKTDPANSKTDPADSKTDPADSKTDLANDQPKQNTTKLKLTKKQQDIRNFCSIPRNRQEILQRAGVSDHFDNRKKYIYDLVVAGVLERTNPDKPNDPNQKYRKKIKAKDHEEES